MKKQEVCAKNKVEIRYEHEGTDYDFLKIKYSN